MTALPSRRCPNIIRLLFTTLMWVVMCFGTPLTHTLQAQGLPPEEPEERPTPQSYNGGLLHFNGLYQSEGPFVPELKTKTIAFMRFYQDGTVLAVTSSGGAEPVSKWLDKDKTGHFSRGAYKVTGNKLTFTTYSSTGAVEYSGEIIGMTLNLNILSHINSKRSTRVYTFAPLWK